jgi:hypothetical protein
MRAKQVGLMKRFASPSWHSVAARRNPDGARLAWDGEVPFIRWVYPKQPLPIRSLLKQLIRLKECE